MAWIRTAKSGAKRVVYSKGGSKRGYIAIGNVSKHIADSYLHWISQLLELKGTGAPMKPAVAEWVGQVKAEIHEQLVREGLADPRRSDLEVPLGKMLNDFFAAWSGKPASRVRLEQGRRAVEDHFKATRDIATITPADADAWRADLAKRYSQATVSRTVLYARQFFNWAIQHGKLTSNPFARVKAGTQSNVARSFFVDRATIEKVIGAANHKQMKLLIALSRYGGLRTPSESLLLRWSDINWEHNRMTVRSPKTEHHEGKGERAVPIFPELLPYLRDVFEAAEPGDDRVITIFRPGDNLNPALRRTIKSAGVTAWPRAWHNLRATRQTELSARHPQQCVCAWMGNSKLVAMTNYLMITDADWTRATTEISGNQQRPFHREVTGTESAPNTPPSEDKGTQDPPQPAAHAAVADEKASKVVGDCAGLSAIESAEIPAKNDQWAEPDLNRQPPHFQCGALPIELSAREDVSRRCRRCPGVRPGGGKHRRVLAVRRVFCSWKMGLGSGAGVRGGRGSPGWRRGWVLGAGWVVRVGWCG